MEHVRVLTLIVITLLQLCRTEISNNLPESWYSANVINDGGFSPKPLTEIFSTETPFSSTNPIVVLPSSSPPTVNNPPISTSTISISQQSVVTSPPSITETTKVIVVPVSVTSQSPQNIDIQPLPVQSQIQSIQPLPQPVQPQPQSNQALPQPVQVQPQPIQPLPQPVQPLPQPVQPLPQPVQEQPQPIQPLPQPVQEQPQPIQSLPQPVQAQPQPIQSLPQPVQAQPQPIQTLIQVVRPSQPIRRQLTQVQPTQSPAPAQPNYFVIYQQAPQSIQNNPSRIPQPAVRQIPQSVPTPSLIPVAIKTTNIPCVNTARPPLTMNVTSQVQSVVSQTSDSYPSFRIRMVSPSGSITNVRFNPTTSTRRPTTTRTLRTKRRNRNNYDECVDACSGRRNPICASPLAVTPIDPNTLKGFPSVCHMACHNSFRKNPYEKVVDGRCGRLRNRVRPVDSSDKLKRDDLNKAQYTIVHTGPQQTLVEFSPSTS